MAERDPNGKQAGEPGAKLDDGKPLIVRGVMHYFPRALKAIAAVSEYGSKKYRWGGWKTVPDGAERYGEALGRHIVDEEIDGPIDPKTGHLHAAHEAWNALARLEHILRDQEAVKPAIPAGALIECFGNPGSGCTRCIMRGECRAKP